MLEEEIGVGGAVMGGAAPPMLVWALWAPSDTSSSSHIVSPKNRNSRKKLVRFEFRKVTKTQKYQGFPILQSYKPMKGDSWKIPIKHYKTCI